MSQDAISPPWSFPETFIILLKKKGLMFSGPGIRDALFLQQAGPQHKASVQASSTGGKMAGVYCISGASALARQRSSIAKEIW